MTNDNQGKELPLFLQGVIFLLYPLFLLYIPLSNKFTSLKKNRLGIVLIWLCLLGSPLSWYGAFSYYNYGSNMANTGNLSSMRG